MAIVDSEIGDAQLAPAEYEIVRRHYETGSSLPDKSWNLSGDGSPCRFGNASSTDNLCVLQQ
ncbi:MAG: hypothetical protein IGR93_18420 [Hydrococcus sp. C42_A2020_068]|nr:hypothetical protein [Hydrococcus sp. C42_A2020_068]